MVKGAKANLPGSARFRYNIVHRKEDKVDTLQTIHERRAVRVYKQEPVPAEHLRRILEAGRQAPSARNRQPWYVIVVGDPEQKQRVAHVCGEQMWMADAAYILVAVGLPEETEKWYKVDTAIALENMVLAARSLGYGTCWVGAFDPEELKKVCGIPAEADVVACAPLGVPEAWPEPRERKAWGELFYADRFGEALDLPS